MKKYSMPRNIWRALYPTIIYFGMQFLALMVFGFVCGIILGARGVTSQTEITQGVMTSIAKNALAITLASNTVCLVIFMPIWLKIRKGLAEYELHQPKAVTLSVVLAFMGLNTLLVLIISMGELISFFPSYEDIALTLASGHPLVRFTMLVISAPVVEELCMRGITLPRLLSWLPTWAAVVVQAALFGLLHLNLLQGLYAFVLGLALGYLYIRCRKLWLCVAAHMAFNLVGFAQSFIPAELAETSVWWLLPGVVVFFAAAWFFFKLPAAQAPAEIAADAPEVPEV